MTNSPPSGASPRRKLFSAERALIGRKQDGVAPVPVAAIDNQEVLDAIASLKELIEEVAKPQVQTPQDMPEMHVLRAQLHELRESIDKTKIEIAALHQKSGKAEDDQLSTAALELGAIVKATETATHNILGAAEDIADKAAELKERSGDLGAQAMCDEITNLTMGIFENCNFQDITGQRIGKVVKVIAYLEDRIMTMIDIWGEEEFVGLEIPEAEKTPDEALLEGPQLEGEGVSQDDIDSLFD